MKTLGITTDTILIDVKGEEVALTGKFYNGYAFLTDEQGKQHFMTYPKAETLTPRMVETIEDYTGRDLEENFEVALKYGKVQKVSAKEFIEAEQRNVVKQMIHYIIQAIEARNISGVVISAYVKLSVTIGDEAMTITPWLLSIDKDNGLVFNCDKENEGRVDFIFSPTAEKYTEFEVAIINYLFCQIDSFIERI